MGDSQKSGSVAEPQRRVHPGWRELASVSEESLGDNRGFIESRDQKHVCVACCKGQSSSLFPTSEQESSPRMQMDRGEVEIEEARQTREREELRSSPQTKRKTNTKPCVQCYATVQFLRERTCEALPHVSNK